LLVFHHIEGEPAATPAPSGIFAIFQNLFSLRKRAKEIVSNVFGEDDIQVKTNRKGKGKNVCEFEGLSCTQTIAGHAQKIYCMKFSVDGFFLATAGKDLAIKIWSIGNPPIFSDQHAHHAKRRATTKHSKIKLEEEDGEQSKFRLLYSEPCRVFYHAHTSDIVDLSWSKSRLLLSCSIDKTVRLWHVAREYCLKVFVHPDIPTSIDFHPIVEGLFISGCMDRTVRLWNIIPDSDVAVDVALSSASSHFKAPHYRTPKGSTFQSSEPEFDGTSSSGGGADRSWASSLPVTAPALPIDTTTTPDIITAIKFTPDGTMVIVGLVRGEVLFYSMEKSRLRFFTQVELRNRAGEYKEGCKVRGIHFWVKGAIAKGLAAEQSSTKSTSIGQTSLRNTQMLVTTNDDRIRLLNLDDYVVLSKYRGAKNNQTLIQSSISADGKYIISGSDTGVVHIWQRDPKGNNFGIGSKSSRKGSSLEKNTNGEYEFFDCDTRGNAAVSCAIFAPEAAVAKATQLNAGHYLLDYLDDVHSRIIVTADFKGVIRVFSRGLNA